MIGYLERGFITFSEWDIHNYLESVSVPNKDEQKLFKNLTRPDFNSIYRLVLRNTDARRVILQSGLGNNYPYQFLLRQIWSESLFYFGIPNLIISFHLLLLLWKNWQQKPKLIKNYKLSKFRQQSDKRLRFTETIEPKNSTGHNTW